MGLCRCAVGQRHSDNIHSLDVAWFIDCFITEPRVAGVYNIGGGRANSISILEAFQTIRKISGKPMKYEYVEKARIGDHICYISDLTKMKAHYPQWDIAKDLRTILIEIHDAWLLRMKEGASQSWR